MFTIRKYIAVFFVALLLLNQVLVTAVSAKDLHSEGVEEVKDVEFVNEEIVDEEEVEEDKAAKKKVVPKKEREKKKKDEVKKEKSEKNPDIPKGSKEAEGKYVLTGDLNKRAGAGVEHETLGVAKKGEEIKAKASKKNGDTEWIYGEVDEEDVWLSSAYLTTTASVESDYEWKDVDGGVEITSGPTSGDLVIPDTLDGSDVVSIGYGAFEYNELTSVIIPNSVTNIGEKAFYYSELTSIVIPDSITNIRDSAFAGNELTSVEIPDSVTSIEDYAFYDNELTSVEIPNSVISIGYVAFYGNDLTSVEIPDSVTSIGDSAFSYNNLTSVVIPDSVTSIGDEAFYNNNLTSVEIPYSVTSIGRDMFRFNELTSVVIPDSVTSIVGSAFASNNLTSIEIPKSVTIIGVWAFDDNPLEEIRGYDNSAAQNYANNERINFTCLDCQANFCEAPKDIVVMIDASYSFYDKIGVVKNTLKATAKGLENDDRMMVVSYQGRNGNKDLDGTIKAETTGSFGLNVKVQSPLTDNLNTLESGIDNIKVNGATPTATGIERALSEYERTKGDIEDRNTAFVLITDGVANVRKDGWLYYDHNAMINSNYQSNFERVQDYKTAIDQSASEAEKVKENDYMLITSFLEDYDFLTQNDEYPDNYNKVSNYSKNALKEMATDTDYYVESGDKYTFANELMSTIEEASCVTIEEEEKDEITDKDSELNQNTPEEETDGDYEFEKRFSVNVGMNTIDWTNKGVDFDIKAIDNFTGIEKVVVKFFDEDGSVEEGMIGEKESFNVKRNGTYTFTAHNNEGETTTNTVVIDNIDEDKPMVELSQNGSIIDEDEGVNISAKDNASGIKKVSYTWSNSSETPSDFDETESFELETKEVSIDTNLPEKVGNYYLHIQAEDHAGNIEMITSEEFEVLGIIEISTKDQNLNLFGKLNKSNTISLSSDTLSYEIADTRESKTDIKVQYQLGDFIHKDGESKLKPIDENLTNTIKPLETVILTDGSIHEGKLELDNLDFDNSKLVKSGDYTSNLTIEVVDVPTP